MPPLASFSADSEQAMDNSPLDRRRSRVESRCMNSNNYPWSGSKVGHGLAQNHPHFRGKSRVRSVFRHLKHGYHLILSAKKMTPTSGQITTRIWFFTGSIHSPRNADSRRVPSKSVYRDLVPPETDVFTVIWDNFGTILLPSMSYFTVICSMSYFPNPCRTFQGLGQRFVRQGILRVERLRERRQGLFRLERLWKWLEGKSL